MWWWEGGESEQAAQQEQAGCSRTKGCWLGVGSPCLSAPSFCPSPICRMSSLGASIQASHSGSISSKVQTSGARDEADGVGSGQLPLQVPQGCWAWPYHDCAGALRLVRDTRPSDRPATTTGAMTTVGRYLVTSLEIYHRCPREGVIAILPMRKLSLRSDHLLVVPQPDSLTADSSQACQPHSTLRFRGTLKCQPHVSLPHVAILLYPS